jgi:aryl-alcohol dehydrogenase-like predicted oxidoreductase
MWVGSPETVRRQVEQTLERLPLKYVMAWQYNGLIPRKAITKSIELFNDKVLAKI